MIKTSHKVPRLSTLLLFVDPMFRFIVQNSPDCQENQINFDLRKIAYLARWYDQQIAKSPTNEGPKILNITAVAFHESRCGSTLVANSMIAMDPVKHRTYSESGPTIKAFFACGEDDFDQCSEKQAATILKDTIYMLSRSDDHREERVFFKFQSTISRQIKTFQMAFPDVPWIYVYREPVQVVMSHYKDDPTMVCSILSDLITSRASATLNRSHHCCMIQFLSIILFH